MERRRLAQQAIVNRRHSALERAWNGVIWKRWKAHRYPGAVDLPVFVALLLGNRFGGSGPMNERNKMVKVP
jgi:hypothetical protein